MHLASTVFFLATLSQVACQQISDVWQTTWDKQKLFTYFQPTPGPIDFVTPGAIGSADIVVNDSTIYQTIHGFGASLTDSSASLLSTLKSTNQTSYWKLLDYLFNITDGSNSAGFSYIRVPLGATDFSAMTYSYNDANGDVDLNAFNISATPSAVFSTLKDILSINQWLRVHVVPWSPPGWMKSGTMNGGSLSSTYTSLMAKYLFMCVRGFSNEGIPVYAIGIQNEPENSNPTYPSCSMEVSMEAQIGTALRSLMDSNGFSTTKVTGYEHNWSDAANYPVQLMQQAGDAFHGVSFHCYAGSVSEQTSFASQHPDKELYLTECSGTIGSDWWTDIKWYMENLFIGSINYGSSTGLMWNLALDSTGGPELPGSDSCGGGCRGVVQINSDGTWSVNQEFYAMAQASKAILPRDQGGPWGQRIGVSIGGDLGGSLVVGAYVTGRISPTDWNRYSIVVLNTKDTSGSATWDPQPITTTIEFRGKQATYVFPVGVTTLWWYATP